jgi:DNA-binding response OmpR family regulator
LLDVMMPRMDGFEVAVKLFEEEATAAIAVVFMSARAEFTQQARGIELGGVEYVTKPFNPVQLSELVERVLSVSQYERPEFRRQKLEQLRALNPEG